MIKANRSDHTAARGAMSSEVKGGLEDVVVSTSAICFIDGQKGRLLYRGFDIDDLVEHSSFEEVVYLLWHGALPSRKELDAHVKVLSATATRKLPPGLIVLLRALPKKTTPMEVLRTGVSALSAFDPDAADNSREATARKAVRLTAQIPTLVAAWERIRRGKPLVAPNPKLSLAANFLTMLRGGAPTPLEVKTFDVALMLHADHEFNASTFAARVTAATMSDLHSAITSAIGALKGPLHGGANEQVMRMVEQIGAPERAEGWIRKALADKARVMGFGHRVYRVEDPRAKHLRRLALELGQQAGDTRACLGSLRATTEPFRLVVMDTGSTDGTPEFFERFPYPYPLTFARSPANDGVIAALNRAWRLADTEVLCFLHNDTELLDPAWLSRLLRALAEPGAGLAGFYGAKRLRADGRAVGRTIVHSLAPAPPVRAPWEDVAFVDSVCMCLPRDLVEAMGGFDEGYGFYHGHDRDLSLAVLERGRRCLVVHAPFRHHGGGTRTRDFTRDPARQRADLAMRDAALVRFTQKWHHRLPCDVRSARQRVGDWFRTKLA